MKFIKQLLAFAMLLGVAFAAQATDRSLGMLSAGYTGFGPYSVSGSFLDKINFTLGNENDGGFGAGALNFSVGGTPILNISNLSMSLFDSSNQQLGAGLDFSVNSLVAGDYYLQVTGIADGVNGGVYAGGINVTPVPEPGSWILFLAGVGMMGLMVSRRRQMY